MGTFDELARGVSFLVPPVVTKEGTLYQCRSDDFYRRGCKRDPADWGMTSVYRVEEVAARSWLARLLQIRSACQVQLEALQLGDLVRLVPYYEVGVDYVAMPKPAADGGYSSGHFGEFIDRGTSKPPPGFVLARATLLDRWAESEASLDAGSPGRTTAIRAVLHNSLVRPWSSLFWDDHATVPWTLYQPCVEREQIEAWSR